MDLLNILQNFGSIEIYFELFFVLMCGHALADYALQNDFVAMAKNHKTDLGKMYWKWVLPSHGLIHALPVYLFAGFHLAVAEFIVHTITDYLKCDGKIGFQTDQWIHLGSKVLWVVLIATEIPFFLR